MKRYRQTIDEILGQLSPVDTGWRDAHADAVIHLLERLPEKDTYVREDLITLLQSGDTATDNLSKHRFEAGLTLVRLFLDLSKDEFTAELRDRLGKGHGITRVRTEPERYYGALEEMGILDRMAEQVNRPVVWSDLLVERLKGGRGSAIKGQRRGRNLEDFVEQLVTRVFGEQSYDARCQFVGETGTSTEKADFAIPSRDDPSILIEVKAYGATGSKHY